MIDQSFHRLEMSYMYPPLDKTCRRAEDRGAEGENQPFPYEAAGVPKGDGVPHHRRARTERQHQGEVVRG